MHEDPVILRLQLGETYVGYGSSTENMAPKQAPALQATVPAGLKLLAMSLSVLVARWGLPASLRAG